MIILRQKEFTEENKGKSFESGKKEKGAFLTHEELSKTKKESFEKGKEAGAREAREKFEEELENRAAKKAKRAKRIKQIDEYTGLGDLKAWARKKGEGAKNFIKTHKKAVKTGTKVGAGLVAASGLTYGGVKAVKKYKDKKKSEDIRKKVRGYDTTKKKK